MKTIRLALCSLAALLLLSMTSLAQSPQQFNLIPQPKSIKAANGEMPLKEGFTTTYSGVRDADVEKAVARLYLRLSSKLGFVVFPQPLVTDAPTFEIAIAEKASKVQRVQEDESYTLTVTPSGAKLSAKTPYGALRGLETLLQLAANTNDGFGVLPAVTIEDAPRFPWRGLLYDVSRHFFPVEHIKREIDGLAAVKLNVLHLHLSDDQAFRVESKKFPDLARKSSHGQFYTQDEIRDIIAYARERGVRVIPEFDVPGHTTAWLQTFPELAVNKNEIDPRYVSFGILKNTIDPTDPKTIKMLDTLFGEMAGLFPDEYFHIGGDEVEYDYWSKSPELTAFRQKHNLADNQALQAYFNNELDKILRKHHKKMVGWNEILHGDLPKTTVIHSWKGVEALQEAVNRGYPVIVSLGQYLDHFLPADYHYGNDPLKPDPKGFDTMMELTPGLRNNKGMIEQRENAAKFKAPENADKLVMGGEAAEWAEMAAPWSLDNVLWPRLGAVSERLWSPADVRDVDSLYRRLPALKLILADIGISPDEQVHRLRIRLAGSEQGAEALGIFAETLRPVTFYARNSHQQRMGRNEVQSPLNRFVDAVAPESLAARDFGKLVESYVASKDPATLVRIRTTLERWQSNLPATAQLTSSTPRLADTVQLVSAVRAQVAAGLDAVSYLERKEVAPEWWAQSQKMITGAQVPLDADLQIAITRDVQRLVEAASSK